MGSRAIRCHLRHHLFCSFTTAPAAQQAAKGGINSIQQEPLKEWLTYIASDELQGRATYSEGLGLAAGYISSHLAQWGVKPAGDNGTYLQVVKVLGVRTTSRATVTVEVNGQTRTFNDGEGITFPKNMGGKQTVVADQIQFAGYGLTLPAGTHDDYADGRSQGQGRRLARPVRAEDLRDADCFRLLNSTRSQPRGDRQGRDRRDWSAWAAAASAAAGAAARLRATDCAGRDTATPAPRRRPRRQPRGRGRGAARRRRRFHDRAAVRQQGHAGGHRRGRVLRVPLQRVGTEVRRSQGEGREAGAAAAVRAQGRQDHLQRRRRLHHRPHAPHPQRRRHRRRQRPEAEGHLRGLRCALRPRRLSRGLLGGGRGGQAPANPDDRINNGADDDGSGTVAIMAIARAFAQGPKPKRSLLFVWHAGEENGLLGSRYNADYPVVPIDKIVAQLNMDMVGRNRNDDPQAGEHRPRRRLRSHQHRAPQPQRGRQRVARQADDAGLRDERPGGHRVDLHAQRSLQLRGQGDPDHLLLHRAPPRLPRAERQRRQDHLRQDPARGAARVRDRPPRREPGSRAGAGQQGTEGGEDGDGED